MNVFSLHTALRIALLLACVSLFFAAAPAYADVRRDAEEAVLQLHRNPDTARFPDEMTNLDLVFEIAQRYEQESNPENAEKFFLLALQKAQIIEALLKSQDSERIKPYPEVKEAVPPSDPEQTPEKAEESVPSGFQSDRIVGAQGVYVVVKSDTIRLVAAKLGVTQQHLRGMNGLTAKSVLKVGQKLAYNNRKIIPQRLKNGIVINIPDRTLYYFQQGELVTSLPVAVGSATKNEKYVWQTPVGKFKVTGKVKDPTWTVPPSIQTEMEEQGKEVVTSIPPGPANPLGKYAIKTSLPGIMIHSTTRPSSIYSFSSHGCVRLSPDQMEEFFPQVKVNTRGEIIYRPVKLAVTENGRVFLEVHRDVYSRSAGLDGEARQMIEKMRLSDQIDWEKFKKVVTQKSGIAEDISL